MDSPAVVRPLGHRPALDGLRGLAVIAVVVYHTGWFGLGGGSLGVDLFFVLSGFLITRLLVDEHQRTGTVSFRRFFLRRGLRLLPALFAMLLVLWFAQLVFDLPRLSDRFVVQAAWVGGYVANWDAVLFERHHGALAHLWSLSVEEQFYLLWPWVAAWRLRRGGVASVAAWAGAGTLLLMVVTMLRITVGVSPWLLYYSTESHGAILMLGGATLGALPAIADGVPRPVADVLAVAALAAFAFMMTSTGPFSLVLYETGYLIVLVPAIALVMVSAHPDSRVTRLLGFSPLTWLGRRSYGIYLWHLPVLNIILDRMPSATRWEQASAYALGTLGVAWLSFVVIERPALALKSRFAAVGPRSDVAPWMPCRASWMTTQ